MGGPRDLSDLANVDYVARVNRAIDHVLQNMTEPLKLDDVARIACFSPFHFHRIFKHLTGETLASFVKRVRLERALYLLSHRPNTTLTDVALACGFSSSSDFSRSFKAQYGVPPRVFDVARYRQSRREDFPIAKLPPNANPDGFEVELVDRPARLVAYSRVHRPFEEGRVTGAAEALVAWARARGLAGGQWLGYMWEDPELVPLDQCRYDVGLEIARRELAEDVSVIEFPAMRVARIEIAGDIELEQRAIDWLYGTWLPSSGYAPDDKPAFEAWVGEPFAHGVTHFELALELPVVDARAPL